MCHKDRHKHRFHTHIIYMRVCVSVLGFGKNCKIVLHVFVDTSTELFSSAIYARILDLLEFKDLNNVCVCVLCVICKVAPIFDVRKKM